MRKSSKKNSLKDSDSEAARIAKRREALELAETHGVAGACRKVGISRTCYYRWKRRYEPSRASESLKSRPPVHIRPRQLKSPSIVEKVLQVSRSRPDWGCVVIAEEVNSGAKDERERVSSPTVQKILIRHGIGSRHERWLLLEDELWQKKPLPISFSTETLVSTLKKNNPCLRERNHRPAHPGGFLTQDTFIAGTFEGIGKIYVQAVVDIFSCYTFARVYDFTPVSGTTLLQEALTYFASKSLRVVEVRSLPELKFSRASDYSEVLLSNGIKHTTDKRRHGFAERFGKTARADFFRRTSKEKPNVGIETLRLGFEGWLDNYNQVRPHHGFPNHGKPPSEIITEHLAARDA